MKKLPTGLCVLLAIVLVAFGLLFGTWSGYREERGQVEALLTMENGMMDVLSYRAADGLNLCAVAKRHLPADDAALTALENIARRLQQADAFMPEWDRELAQRVDAVTEALLQSESFQQSQRDRRYLDMLKADLSSLRASQVVSAYNQAAEAFNLQLDRPLTGDLAMLLGIEECPLYQ